MAEARFESNNPQCGTPMESASAKMYAECERVYGAERVHKTALDPKDAGATVGLYVLGPDLSTLLGQDETRTIGQDVILFGAAPLSGLCETAKDQWTKHTDEALKEGARNLGFGTAAGVAAELHPAVAAVTLVGGTALLTHEELLSDHAKKRNAEVAKIAERAGTYNNDALTQQARRMSALTGEDLYHLTYATVSSGMTVKPGRALAAEVARFEPEISSPPTQSRKVLFCLT